MMTLQQSLDLIGGLSEPSKMPCYGYSISASLCKVGAKLRKIKDSVCNGCYAFGGNYRFPKVKNAHQKRLESLENPQWVDAMAIAIKAKDSSGYFRHFDAGDIQGVWHLEKLAKLARKLPNVIFWLPTKEYKIVTDFCAKNQIPSNLRIRLSAYMIDGPLPLALAARLGVTVSGVSSGPDSNCPAPNQGNKCLTCRKCWESKEPVIYKKH